MKINFHLLKILFIKFFFSAAHKIFRAEIFLPVAVYKNKVVMKKLIQTFSVQHYFCSTQKYFREKIFFFSVRKEKNIFSFCRKGRKKNYFFIFYKKRKIFFHEREKTFSLDNTHERCC